MAIDQEDLDTFNEIFGKGNVHVIEKVSDLDALNVHLAKNKPAHPLPTYMIVKKEEYDGLPGYAQSNPSALNSYGDDDDLQSIQAYLDSWETGIPYTTHDAAESYTGPKPIKDHWLIIAWNPDNTIEIMPYKAQDKPYTRVC